MHWSQRRLIPTSWRRRTVKSRWRPWDVRRRRLIITLYECTTSLGRQTTTSDYYVCKTSLGRRTTTSDHYVCTTSLGRRTMTSDHYVCMTSLGRQMTTSDVTSVVCTTSLGRQRRHEARELAATRQESDKGQYNASDSLLCRSCWKIKLVARYSRPSAVFLKFRWIKNICWWYSN